MMYVVATSLKGTDADRAAVESTVRALGPWSSRIQGVWLVESALSARRIRDLLKPHLKPDDRVFVAEMTQNWSGRNMGDTFPQWIARRNFGSSE